MNEEISPGMTIKFRGPDDKGGDKNFYPRWRRGKTGALEREIFYAIFNICKRYADSWMSTDLIGGIVYGAYHDATAQFRLERKKERRKCSKKG